MTIPRRVALKTVAMMAGYLYGAPTSYEGKEMRLLLDGIESILVVYKGATLRITPAELIESLKSAK